MFAPRASTIRIFSLHRTSHKAYKSSFSFEFTPNKIYGEPNRIIFSERINSLTVTASNVMPIPPLKLEPNQVAGAILVPLCTVSNEPALLLCLRPLHMRASPGELWFIFTLSFVNITTFYATQSVYFLCLFPLC